MNDIVGLIPNRMALAGGWIDQPFVSKNNARPPGSMVVVSLEPEFRFMERCGMASSTRRVAMKLWGGSLPDRDKDELVRELYEEENRGLQNPSGSQDMIGLIYPGINRLDFDSARNGGIFPFHIETCIDPIVVHWLENILWIIPVTQRPETYDPLKVRNLDPEWIARLGETGKHCFDAIVTRNIVELGKSMNECMECWEAILPYTLTAPEISVDLKGILSYYQARYSGAMYSGCGGGYMFVASEKQVPGSFSIHVRLK